MECSRVKAILFENADTELPEEVRKTVEAHLAECRSCAELRESLREQVRALGSLPRMQAPSGLLQNVRRKVEKPSPLKSFGAKLAAAFGPGRFLQLAATAAVALIVVGTLRVSMQDESMRTVSLAPPQTAVQAPAPAPSPAPLPEAATESPAKGMIPEEKAGTVPKAESNAAPASTDDRRQEATRTLKIPEPPAQQKTGVSAQAPAPAAAYPGSGHSGESKPKAKASKAPAPRSMAEPGRGRAEKSAAGNMENLAKGMIPAEKADTAPPVESRQPVGSTVAREKAVTLTMNIPSPPAKRLAAFATQAPALVLPSPGPEFGGEGDLTAKASRPPAPRAPAAPGRGGAKGLGQERSMSSEAVHDAEKERKPSPETIEPPPKDRRSVLTEVRGLIARANGTILSPVAEEGEELPGELLARIPAEGYPALVDRLRRLGPIEPAGEEFRPLPGTSVLLTLKFKSR